MRVKNGLLRELKSKFFVAFTVYKNGLEGIEKGIDIYSNLHKKVVLNNEYKLVDVQKVFRLGNISAQVIELPKNLNLQVSVKQLFYRTTTSSTSILEINNTPEETKNKLDSLISRLLSNKIEYLSFSPTFLDEYYTVYPSGEKIYKKSTMSRFFIENIGPFIDPELSVKNPLYFIEKLLSIPGIRVFLNEDVEGDIVLEGNKEELREEIFIKGNTSYIEKIFRFENYLNYTEPPTHVLAVGVIKFYSNPDIFFHDSDTIQPVLFIYYFPFTALDVIDNKNGTETYIARPLETLYSKYSELSIGIFPPVLGIQLNSGYNKRALNLFKLAKKDEVVKVPPILYSGDMMHMDKDFFIMRNSFPIESTFTWGAGF